MRILLSLTYYTPYLSGLTLYAKRIAEYCVRHGDHVSVLTMQYDCILPPAEQCNGVRVVRVPVVVRLSKGFLSFSWLLSAGKEVRGHDVVVIHLPQAEGVIPALWARLFRKRLIVVYHCDVMLPPGLFNRLVEATLAMVHRLTLWLSDAIVTNTSDFARHSALLAPYRSKIHCIYPPMIKQRDTGGRTVDAIRSMASFRGIRIGMVGRMAAEKGIEYLLQSIPLLQQSLPSPFRIYLVGPVNPVGEEEYRRRIETLLNQYPHQVQVLGVLPDAQMGAFFSLLDVLVFPSVNATESFGMAQGEAMMLGVPVVVSDLPGMRVPVQKTGMGRLIPPCNSQALAHAICTVIKEKGAYRNRRTLAEQEFSDERSGAAFLQLLHQTV